jgi:hypothetical protein
VGPSAEREALSETYLIPLDPATDRVPAQPEVFRFQYYPESISSTKATNWQQREIPGGSLPLYQFVSGGEHVISFSANFSCDTDLLSNTRLMGVLRGEGLRERNVDIRAAVAWLRQFVLPRYAGSGGQGTPIFRPPRKLMLFMPGTGIGLLAGATASAPQVQPDSLYCVMTQCDVNHESFFPSGLPRSSMVQLAFGQIPQYGGGVEFPGVTASHDKLLGPDGPFLGYQLPTRNRLPTGGA